MATDDFADETFTVSDDSNSANENPEFEGANVCRVAVLSTMLGNNQQAIRDLAPELEQLGFSPVFGFGEWNWSDLDPLQLTGDLRSQDGPRELRREWRWRMIGETRRPQAAVGFLADVLGSRLERESTAAAAALWRLQPFDYQRFRGGPRWWHLWDRLFDLWEPEWPDDGWWRLPWSGSGGLDPTAFESSSPLEWDPDRWQGVYGRVMSRLGDPYGDLLLLQLLSGWRLARALRSPDRTTKSLAMAAFTPEPSSDSDGEPPTAAARTTAPGALMVSTMVHGTWGWKGDWWRPRGSFHEYILRMHRPNLYSRGAKFSWSGAYSDRQRTQAAVDFGEWTYDVAPHGLQSVFAHSYGGEVVARAAMSGTSVAEMVLLSVPVTKTIEAAADRGVRIVDVRLRFDPVLGLARTRQRIKARPNVTEVLLDRWRYDHGATHRRDVWDAEDIARRGGI